MKILIVGNGGREHTLLWKLRRDAPDAHFFVTRPNGGMARLCTGIDLSPTDVAGVAGWASGEGISLALVGPEAPLAEGMADALSGRGIPCFGPSAAAARIESSKAFSKDLMENAGIPTAAHRNFTDLAAAEAYLRARGAPIVVKASGLAAGKGAVVCMELDEALATAREMLSGDAFGAAGSEIVIEDFMEGEELSVFALTDGQISVPMIPSQDHKRAGEGDTGPNTGGMGAYAPVTLATAELMEQIQDVVLHPTLEALAAAGAPFRGLLYAGLMITAEGPKVVEFNCRFGDPETQVVLPLMDSSLLEVTRVIAEGGSLEGYSPSFSNRAALTTVLASPGYPGSYPKGHPIDVPDSLGERDDTLVFHAGTTLTDRGLETSGGRVMAVTGLGESLAEAADRSRTGAQSITFEGRQLRRDIGWRELARRGTSEA